MPVSESTRGGDMYTKTYYELRQAAYFTAAASMYDAASAVLNDCTEPAEYRGATYEWARELAKTTAEKAQALKEQALAEGAVSRAPVKFNRAQARYSEAVTRHLRLRQEYGFNESVSSGRETWKVGAAS